MRTNSLQGSSDKVGPPTALSGREEAVMKVLGYMTSKTLDEDKERAELANRSIIDTLYQHVLGERAPSAQQLETTTTDKRQIHVLKGYVNLAVMRFTIRNCEYYFRRYPFSGLPLTRADHLRNMSEMFFDRVVQFRDRLKATLNAIKASAAPEDIPVSKMLKSFDRMFDPIIRLRNQVHHRDRYDDHLIEQLNLISILSHSEIFAASLPDEEMLFRRAAKVWSKRVQEHAAAIDVWCDTVAGLILDHCAFAKEALVAANAKQASHADASDL